MRLASAGMRVHTAGIRTAAHNIANVSTDGFTPRRAVYATGPDGVGVDLQTIRKVGPGLEEPPSASPRPSGVELAEEIPHMISSERGFQANAAAIRSADEMAGYLLDAKA